MRGRRRAGGVATPWPQDADKLAWAAFRASPRFRDVIQFLSGKLRAWAAFEAAPGRLAPWLPVAFGLGVVGYFSATREPVVAAALIACGATAAFAFLLRRRGPAFVIAILACMTSCGFAVGTFVQLKARLNPPLTPLRPGGYDFARDLFFQQIGASGMALGGIRRVDPPEQPRLKLRLAAAVAGIRDAIDARIRTALPGDVGAIASALITGKRDAISGPVNEAMYVSSLAHVLSISG